MSDVKRDFLVELGTEELPPKALSKLARAFAAGIESGLDQAKLGFTAVEWYATPRRLAVIVRDLDVAQADREVERRGPAVQAAFGDDGCATPAASGFARSCGVAVEDLQTVETDKGAWLVHRFTESGQSVTELLPGMVEQSLARLPIPKRMRWGSIDHQFVRPAHWLVMLFGTDVIECKILGLKAGRETRGHRFHAPQSLVVSSPDAWLPLLETEGHVMASFAGRRSAIEAQIQEAALKLGGVAIIDEALLDEVTGLVEWPRAVTGSFDQRFLDVPPEVLISAMKGHQKYFHVLDEQNQLMPNFITVSNIESKKEASVVRGNERVIRPRLTDAEFFWQQDQKQTLASRVPELANIVFQQKLGSLLDKVKRIEKLAASMAAELGLPPEQAERAAHLCKSDLMTEMVGEFPELQGIMGEYYARLDGETDAVAAALNQQYQPRFAGDDLAAEPLGQILGIADKLDTLVGIFGIGQLPTGDKDPFALRRSALGIMRTLIEKQLDLDLMQLIDTATELFEGLDQASLQQLGAFMFERLRGYYADQGISTPMFDAVAAVSPARPLDFDARIHAIRQFQAMVEAASLAAANKRIRNILKKSSSAAGSNDGTVDSSLLSEKEEKALYDTLLSTEAEVNALLKTRDYAGALTGLAHLKSPVDAFFDQVMVNADDAAVRNNRLALLSRLNRLCSQVADLSLLQG